MSINVYSWPPVFVHGWEWTERAPVRRSQSLLTGADLVTADQRIRRMASLEVDGARAMGAGYVESLKKFLDGGVNAVRLYSMPVNRYAGYGTATRQSQRILWEDSGTDVEWEDSGTDVLWYDGKHLTGTTGTDADGFSIITVSGLPANTLVVQPSEFLTVYDDPDDYTGTTVRVITAATSDGSGVAVIRLFDSPGAHTDARVNIGTRDTGVFRPVNIPRSPQMINSTWTYTWQFYEVFEEEVGTFVEVDPW